MFHSIRHSFNSAMANADVPLAIRQKDMNKQYTHLQLFSRLPGKASGKPQQRADDS
jgi:hypothetical protein